MSTKTEETKEETVEKEPSTTKQDIFDAYVGLVRDSGNTYISMSDLDDAGFTEGKVRHHWKSLAALDKEAREKHPDLFFDTPLVDLLSPKTRSKLAATIEKYSRFFITTAVTGCRVDLNFLESIKSYCRKMDAALLVLMVSDPAHNRDKDGWGYIDKALEKDKDVHLVVEDSQLNDNFFINTIKLSAKHIDPVTSLERIGQRDGSFVYASPKQRLKIAAVGNSQLSRAIMTTGAVTLPNYDSKLYMSQRTAYIANHDHVMGGIVVEVESDRRFYFRQVQSDENGSFIDLGVCFSGNKRSKIRPEALIPGDIHVDETDPKVQAVIDELTTILRPKKKVFHDVFNGTSINHHEKNDIATLARKARDGLLCLESELLRVAEYISKEAETVDEVVIVKSNHDEFLDGYLKNCEYKDDPHNHVIALEIAQAWIRDKKDPLKYGTERFKLKNRKKVRWLERDEDFKIAHIQCGAHGDKGPNGSRGSIKSLEKAYGYCVIGHSHTPQILRGAWQTGTSTYHRVGYNKGASSWMQTMCIVYPNGSRQLINVIDGDYRLKDDKLAA